MARSSSRDVSLTLSIETLGEEGIRKLEDSVRALAKEGGDAGPEFQQLANQLARIGEQRDALQAFRTIADETARLEQRQTEAASAVQRLTDDLTQQGIAVAAARAKQAEASQEVQRLQAALTEATAAVKQNRTGYDESGQAIEGYKTKTAGLIAEQAKIKTQLDEARVAQRDANKEVAYAVKAQNALETQLERAEKAATSASTAVKSNKEALTEASAAAEKLGVSTGNVAEAEGQLLAAFNQVGAAAQSVTDETNEYTQAQDRLKFALQSQQAEADESAQAYARQVQFIEDAEDAIRAYEDALEQAADAEAQRIADAASAEAAWLREADAIVEAAEATQRFERDVSVAAEAARQLRNIRAFEEQAEQAQELLRASEYVEFWTRALNDAEAETKQFQGALDRLDVRSVEQIKEEIDQTRQAMATLAARSEQTGESFKGAFTTGQARIQALEREIREVAGALTLADKAADLFKNSIGQITAGNLLADAIGSIVERVKDMGRQFFTVNIEFERLRRALTVVTGSADEAAKKIDFLRKVANNSGQSISGITDAFIRFQASAISAGIASEKVDDIFQLVVNSGGKLGLTSDQVAGSLEALGQVASKGVLSLEELRQQLGDRFPAALAITAKGMGFAENEIGKFVKQVELGAITSNEFFNGFKRGITDTFGDATVRIEGLLPSFNRLKNALTEIAQDASGSVFFTALANTLDIVASNLRTVVDGAFALAKAFAAIRFAQFVSGFGDTARAAKVASVEIAASTAAAVTNAAVVTRGAAANQAYAISAGVMSKALTLATAAKVAATAVTGALTASYVALGAAAKTAYAAIGGPVGVLVTLAVFYKDIGTAVGEAAAKFVLWARGAKDADAELARLAEEEKKRADARRAQQEELELLAARQISTAVEVRKSLESKLEVDTKAVKAAEASAEASKSLVALLDDEAKSLATTAEGAIKVAEAKQKAADTSAAVVKAFENEIAKIDATRDANGRLTSAMEEARTKAVQLRDERIELTERMQAEAESAKDAAAAQRIAAESYGDLSEKVEELGRAAAEANLLLRTLTEAGIKDTVQLANATREAGIATQVYRKALEDKAQAIKATSDLEQAKINVTLSGIKVRQDELEQMAASARASGDTARAVQLEVQAKHLQIEAIDLSTTAKAVELRATREQILLEREQLSQAGKLVGAKQSEIEARLQNVTAKEAELRLAATQKQAVANEIAGLRNLSSVIQAKSQVEQANYNVMTSLLGVQQKRLEQQAAAARASGKEEDAIKLEVQAKEKQIEIINLTTQAKIAEADATIEAAEAELVSLANSKELTEAKRLEIEARIKNAQAKRTEAGASSAAVAGIRAEIAAIKDRTRAQREDNRVWAQGSPAVRAAGTDLGTRTGIVNFLKGAGIQDEDLARQIASEFADSRGNVPYFNNPGQVKYGGDTISQALLKAAERITFGGPRTAAPAKKEPAAETAGVSAEERALQAIRDEIRRVQANADAGTQGLTAEAAELISARRELERAKEAERTQFIDRAKSLVTPVGVSPSVAQPAVNMNVYIGGKLHSIGAGSQEAADATIRAIEAAYKAGGG
jgi:tape measure domain-containing protein